MKELITIQQRLNCPKTLTNKFGGYQYRNLEGIFEAVKPLLKETDCQLTTDDELQEIGGRIFVKATATLTNSKGESISNKGYAELDTGKKGMDASQVTGAASSYARKYALNGLFLIDDVKDADSNEYTAQRQGTKAKPQQQPTPTPAPKPAPTPKQPDTDPELDAALHEYKTVKELMEVWNNTSEIERQDPAFKASFTKRKNELTKA